MTSPAEVIQIQVTARAPWPLSRRHTDQELEELAAKVAEAARAKLEATLQELEELEERREWTRRQRAIRSTAPAGGTVRLRTSSKASGAAGRAGSGAATARAGARAAGTADPHPLYGDPTSPEPTP